MLGCLTPYLEFHADEVTLFCIINDIIEQSEDKHK